LLGYRDAVRGAGIAWPEVAVAAGSSSTVEDGARRAGMVLDLDPRPTALLCLSDALAHGALQAAAARGLAVPGDVSVVGFDDAAPARHLELTTVAQPSFSKGAAAARVLLDLIGSGAAPPPRRLATKLIVRATTGTAPGGG
jgi:DNA-binding LacI/PurR family transcriptional regulator